MFFTYSRAKKDTANLRAAIYGPAGSGKTYSSLAIASALSKKIALIDTERGRAGKYAGVFKFDALELIEKSTENYIRAIEVASDLKYGVLIVDSLSHAWKELLEEVDFLAENKYRGNSTRAWGAVTPKQHRLLEAILSFPGHVMVTLRSKTEWVIEKDEATGAVRPVRLGLAPEQARGIEYEFDLVLELNSTHVASVIKDSNGGHFQDKLIEKPGLDFGRELAGLLGRGRARRKRQNPVPEQNEARELYEEIKHSLAASTTASELDRIARQQAESIDSLPILYRRELVCLGKSLRRRLANGKCPAAS